MNATISTTSALAALGALLEYPDDTFQTRYDEAMAGVIELSADAAESLAALAGDVANLSTDHAQELYSRSFDLSPVCVPYVSVHLFGAESFKRAELMAGLKAAYERVDFDIGSELPDHLALVLQCAPRFEREEWAELCTFVLAPAMEKMILALGAAASPWRHVVRAAQSLLTLGDTTDGY